jgi:hypothetical protein
MLQGDVLLRLLTACVLLALVLSGCSLGQVPPPASAEHPPIYPGARDLHVEKDTYDVGLQEITFSTPDSVADVFSFYKRELNNDGWTFRSDLSDQSSLTFDWPREVSGTSNNYELNITVQREAANTTIVKIKVVTSVPH